jgi:hypothetical protein
MYAIGTELGRQTPIVIDQKRYPGIPAQGQKYFALVAFHCGCGAFVAVLQKCHGLLQQQAAHCLKMSGVGHIGRNQVHAASILQAGRHQAEI